MKAGGEHWQWTPDIPLYIGVLPRRGAQSSDIKVGFPHGESYEDKFLTI